MTSLFDIRNAAQSVIETCVVQTGGVPGGGSIAQLGRFYFCRLQMRVDRQYLTAFIKGHYHGLIVIVRRYDPTVMCRNQDPAPDQGSCTKPIRVIPVSTETTRFGYKSAPGVEVPVPKTYRACILDPVSPHRYDHRLRNLLAGTRCVLTLDRDSLVVQTSWFDIWQGAVAVDSICVDQGQAGRASGLGE